MLDAMLSARDPIRVSITNAPALSGGIKPRLWVGDVDDNTLPYFWLRTASEATDNYYVKLNVDNVYLDAYARSIGELQQMWNMVAFLDDYQFPTYGNAVDPQWRLASKTELPEGARVWHGTGLYTVTYGDKRKLVAS